MRTAAIADTEPGQTIQSSRGDAKHGSYGSSLVDNGSIPRSASVAGNAISLVPPIGDDEPHYRRWFNDFQVQRTSGVVPMPWSEAKFEGYFKERVLLGESAAWFTVVENETGRPV